MSGMEMFSSCISRELSSTFFSLRRAALRLRSLLIERLVLRGGETGEKTDSGGGTMAARASAICCMVGRSAGSAMKQRAKRSRTTGGASPGIGRCAPEATPWITCRITVSHQICMIDRSMPSAVPIMVCHFFAKANISSVSVVSCGRAQGPWREGEDLQWGHALPRHSPREELPKAHLRATRWRRSEGGWPRAIPYDNTLSPHRNPRSMR